MVLQAFENELRKVTSFSKYLLTVVSYGDYIPQQRGRRAAGDNIVRSG